MSIQSRRQARQRVLQLLFQLHFHPKVQDVQINQWIDTLTFPPEGESVPEDWQLGDYPDEAGLRISDLDRTFIREYVLYIHHHLADLDACYQPYLIGWDLARLPIVDRCILRLACYEITQRADIPFSVSINEAIILTHLFGSDRSRRYINAILGKLEKVACPKLDEVTN